MAKQLDLFDALKQPDYLIYSEVFPDIEFDDIEYKSASGGFPKDFWKTALAICQIEGDITNVKLQYHFDLHRSDTTKLLQDLCKNGFLISENKSRWTTYRLNTEFRAGEENANMDSSNMDSSNMDSSNMDSSNVDSSNEDTSNEDTSNEDTSNEDTSNEDTSNEDTSKGRGPSLRTKELYKRIVEVCSDEYISIEAIAEKIARSERHLKNKVIPEMVKKGFLVRLYPPKNHPDQKYISKNKA